MGDLRPCMGGGGKTLLWTNSAPTSAFAAQTISLDLSGYTEVVVECKNYITGATYKKFNIVKGETCWMILEFQDSLAGNRGYRKVTVVNDTGVTFGSGYVDEVTLSNNWGIPYKIYGI